LFGHFSITEPVLDDGLDLVRDGSVFLSVVNVAHCWVSEQDALSSKDLREDILNLDSGEVLGLLGFEQVIGVDNHLQHEIEMLLNIELFAESQLYD
jgi:hypothetical protein